MAEKDFKIQGGLFVSGNADLEGNAIVGGTLTVNNAIISAESFEEIKILTIMGVL